MCQVVCNPGMNFMKVHAFLLTVWFSSLNTLCELVSNRKSSSPSSSARESVTFTCYLRFKNMKWFWQDKYDSKFYNSLMTGVFFLFMASSFTWKTLIAFKMIVFSFDPHSPFDKAKKKYMCVYCHMSKKSRVGGSGLIFFSLFIGKTGNSRSQFRNPIPVFHFRNFR
jgi:hypothetical protein